MQAQLTKDGVVSNTLTVNAVPNAPSLFSYTMGGTTFPSALFANSAVIAGDPAPAGSIVNPAIPFSGPLTVSTGAQFAGLVAAGEYQINVMVPRLQAGLYPVQLTAAGQTSQTGVMAPVQ